ncbi:hypothetical protein [Alkaliphilus peptidifermentans]|nr:hypothetical protein [Alkaliphilus peptidifermentans]
MKFKRKKTALVLSIIMVILLLPMEASAFNQKESNALLPQEDYTYGENMFITETRSSPPDMYIGTPYQESSMDGFVEYTDNDGSRYMMRVRHIKLQQIDVGPIVNSTHVISVPRGMTYSTSETKTIQKSYTSSWNVGANFGINLIKWLDIKVNTQYTSTNSETTTFAVQQGQSYTFPSGVDPSYNIAHFYIGFVHDKYEVVADIVRRVTKQVSTEVYGIEIDDEPRATATVYLADGRVIYMRAELIPLRIIDNYYIEYITEYDYENMETEYGTLLSPKPITYLLLNNLAAK